ncbi:unnamed protein product [Brugia timori]|uniref:CASP-like protein n=1 Tax=Brugia timori TaxID=42155 RepID=A0A0R3QEW3_9BILA|nr:unnamed protein product [Brugia timori]
MLKVVICTSSRKLDHHFLLAAITTAIDLLAVCIIYAKYCSHYRQSTEADSLEFFLRMFYHLMDNVISPAFHEFIFKE